MMLEIKMLYEKWEQGNQLEMENNNVQMINKQENTCVDVYWNDMYTPHWKL